MSFQDLCFMSFQDLCNVPCMVRHPRKTTTAEQQQKLAAKQARRAERKHREAEARRRVARKSRIRRGAFALLAVGFIAAIGWVLVRELIPPELAGVERVASHGRSHLPPGQTGTYAEAAPTSGPHSPSSPRCGVYRRPIPLEIAVHALEHGAVVVWHQEDLANTDLVALRELIGGFDGQVILAPNPELQSPIVATAWNRSKAYESADITTFVETYRGRGPERVDCPA